MDYADPGLICVGLVSRLEIGDWRLFPNPYMYNRVTNYIQCYFTPATTMAKLYGPGLWQTVTSSTAAAALLMLVF